MNKYESPVLEMIKFEAIDIIATSEDEEETEETEATTRDNALPLG